jgi:hypothetical protein
VACRGVGAGAHGDGRREWQMPPLWELSVHAAASLLPHEPHVRQGRQPGAELPTPQTVRDEP